MFHLGVLVRMVPIPGIPGGIWGPAAPPGCAVLLRPMELQSASGEPAPLLPFPSSQHLSSQYKQVLRAPHTWQPAAPLMILLGCTVLLYPALPTSPLPGRALGFSTLPRRWLQGSKEGVGDQLGVQVPGAQP